MNSRIISRKSWRIIFIYGKMGYSSDSVSNRINIVGNPHTFNFLSTKQTKKSGMLLMGVLKEDENERL